MTVYRNQVGQLGQNDGVVLGTIIIPDVSGAFGLDVRSDIADDISAYTPDNAAYACALWSITLINKGSLINIQGFDGSPPRYKLGSISFRTVQTTNSFHFWNYVNQDFSPNLCIVSPSGYQGTPTTESNIPSFLSVRQIVTANSLSTGAFGTTGVTNSALNRPSLYGNTGFGIQPVFNSQLYDVILNYYASWSFTPSGISARFIANI